MASLSIMYRRLHRLTEKAKRLNRRITSMRRKIDRKKKNGV